MRMSSWKLYRGRKYRRVGHGSVRHCGVYHDQWTYKIVAVLGIVHCKRNEKGEKCEFMFVGVKTTTKVVLLLANRKQWGLEARY